MIDRAEIVASNMLIRDALTEFSDWRGEAPPIDATGNGYADLVLARAFRILARLPDRTAREEWLAARLADSGISNTASSVLKRWYIDL